MQAKNQPETSGVNLPHLSNLFALLELVNRTPLLNLSEIDTNAVAKAISEEVRAKQILVPFLFGKEIYEKLAEIEKNEISELGERQSIQLLENTPIGVVHLRNFLIGPLGLIVTDFQRSLNTSNRPFLQHNADRTLTRLHRVYLTTSPDAPVNRLRMRYVEILKKDTSEDAAWDDFFRKHLRVEDEDFDENSLQGIPELLGDTLSDRELSSLVRSLSESVDLVRRQAEECGAIRAGGTPDQDLLERNVLVQLALCASDTQIRDVLCRLTYDGTIKVPIGELRKPVLNGRTPFGQWGTSLELSHYGIRSVSLFQGMPFLRLRHLVELAWNRGGRSYQESLDWSLRLHPGDSTRSKIESILQNSPASDSVRLLLSTYPSSVSACEDYLHLNISGLDDDSEITKKVLWGLSLVKHEPPKRGYDLNRVLSATVGKLREVSTAGREGTSVRGILSDVGPGIESYGRTVLAYLTWALLADKYATPEGFTYYSERATEFTIQELFSGDRNAFNKMTPASIPDRLGNLLNRIEELRRSREKWGRSSSEYPRFAGSTGLQQFPLKYKPFVLNLADESTSELLREISRLREALNNPELLKLRRDVSHDNGAPPDVDDSIAALSGLREAISRAEGKGLFPIPAVRSTSSLDASGRERISYVDTSGLEHHEFRPSSYMLAGVPVNDECVIFLSCARLPDSSQSVIFGVGMDSEYRDYWSDFPNFPLPSGIRDASDSDE